MVIFNNIFLKIVDDTQYSLFTYLQKYLNYHKMKTLNSYIQLSVKKEPLRGNVTRPAMQCFSSSTTVGLYSFKKNSALVFTTPIKEAT